MSEAAEMFGQALAGEMAAMQASEQKFRDAQEGARMKQSEIMAGFTKRLGQQTEMPPAVKEIADVLMAQPQMIPLTQEFLKSLAARYRAAFESVQNDIRRSFYGQGSAEDQSAATTPAA